MQSAEPCRTQHHHGRVVLSTGTAAAHPAALRPAGWVSRHALGNRNASYSALALPVASLIGTDEHTHPAAAPQGRRASIIPLLTCCVCCAAACEDKQAAPAAFAQADSLIQVRCGQLHTAGRAWGGGWGVGEHTEIQPPVWLQAGLTPL